MVTGAGKRVLSKWMDSGRDLTGWKLHQRLRETINNRVLRLCERNKEVKRVVHRLFEHPFFSFVPRPDNHERGDEQQAFVDSQSFVTCALGGNGSGKTYSGAQKLLKFISETPPPVSDTPFWIIANSYEQVCSTCWHQKLRTMIPSEWIDPNKIVWYRDKRGWPYSVGLKSPDGSDRNWILEFKSYEQGRELMQAAAIGGAWFTEQFPFSIFQEVLRGCREWAFPGSVWMELTPVDPEKSIDLQDIYERWVAGDEEFDNWSFYHLNTRSALEAGHVQKEWFDAFYGSVSDEMQRTRMAGMFASYEGAIFQSFTPHIHLLKKEDMERDPDGFIVPPAGVLHRRGIDWGASEEHPFVCLWAYRDALGCWVVYDEYRSTSQAMTWGEHIDAIRFKHHWPGGPLHGNTYADPSRPDLIREFSHGGIPVVRARAGPDSVWPGIETIRRLLKVSKVTGDPMLFIDKPNCPYLAREMATYRAHRATERGVNPKAGKPEPLKRNDDSVDALRYMLYSEHIHTLAKLTGEWVPPKERKEVLIKQTGREKGKSVRFNRTQPRGGANGRRKRAEQKR